MAPVCKLNEIFSWLIQQKKSDLLSGQQLADDADRNREEGPANDYQLSFACKTFESG